MKSGKILVVDDDPAIRRLLRGSLSADGYDVVEASDARSALSSADIDRPSVALLDLGLPDRDGLELIPILSAKGVAVPVISARDATDEKVSALGMSSRRCVAPIRICSVKSGSGFACYRST